MKKVSAIVSLILTLAVLASCIPAVLPLRASAASTWNGTYNSNSGFSSSGSTYSISSAQGLAYFLYTIGQNGTNYSGCTVNLTVDCDMAGINFGFSVWPSYDRYFKGTFNGNNHTISNMKMTASGDHRGAMFRSADGATFKNIVFSNAVMSFTGSKNGYAVLVGYAKGTCNFENISITGGSVTGQNYVGSLVGEIQDTTSVTFRNCSNAAPIKANGTNAGGFLGRFDSDSNLYFYNCTNTGSVTTGGDRAGGMCGHCKGYFVAQDCSNSGTIKAGSSDGGGMVAWIEDDPSSVIRCQNSGSVTATAACAGGMVGYMGSKDHDKSFTATDCTNTGEIYGKTAGGIIGKTDSDAEHPISGCTNRGKVTATGDESAGGIAGYIGGFGKISQCRNYGAVNGTSDNAGGICGEIEDDQQTYTNCYNSGAVTAYNTAGGILGWGTSAKCEAHKFNYCGNSGNITSTSGGKAGGICGGNENKGDNSPFNYCWNVGTVKGNNNIGGIVGYAKNHTGAIQSWNGGVVSSYTTDTGNSHGGIAGYVGDYTGSTYTDCYNWANISGGAYSAGIAAAVRDGSYSRKITVKNAYNAGSITDAANTNAQLMALGNQNGWSNNYYLSSASGNAQGTAKTAEQLKALASTLGSSYCDNSSRGVKIGSTTYYYPILTWYRSLFRYNIRFSDNYSNTNASFNKTYNQTFTVPTPSRTGYTFSYWYDTANSSYTVNAGVTVTAGVNYNTQYFTVTQETNDVENIHADRTYNAKWTPNTYTIAYNGNGSTSGSTSNSSHTYDTAKNLTANGFTRAFTVTYNYNGNGSSNTTSTATATFNGWNTNNGGTGTSYTNQQSVKNLSSTQGATVNLYAKWTDASVTTPNPSRTGYAFAGWYDAASGGSKIADGSSSYKPSANKTLYAHWTPNSLTVNYNGNNPTSGNTSASTFNYDAAATAKTNGFLKTGYTFSSWNTAADGTGTTYAAGASIKNIITSGSKTLYAKWNPNTYTVSYNANGGSGATASSTHTYDEAKNLTANGFSRDDYAFAGWASSQNGAKTYDDKASVSNLTADQNGSVTLYAKWLDASVGDLALGNGTAAISGGSWDSRTISSGSFTGKYGTLTTDGTDVTYTPADTNWAANTDEQFTLTVSNVLGGKTYQSSSKIKIYPQTNILFEETAGQASRGWETITSEPGSAGAKSSVYGYSPAYANSKLLSGGSALHVTAEDGDDAETYSFTFTGTGYDIYASCDNASGLMIVETTTEGGDAVYDANGKKVKAKAVNTFFGSENVLRQAPVIHIDGLTYGKYKVTVTVAYNEVFDKTQNVIPTAGADTAAAADEMKALAAMGFADADYYCVDDGENLTDGIASADDIPGLVRSSYGNKPDGNNPYDSDDRTDPEGIMLTKDYEVTIDGIRIYNPAGVGLTSGAIRDQYAEDGELNPRYINIRAQGNKNGNSAIASGSLYIAEETDQNGESVSGSASSASWTEYNKLGANHEIMLSDDVVAFTLVGYNAGDRVHVSLRSPFGTDIAAQIGDSESNVVNVKSSTEMYYDITDYVSGSSVAITSANGILAVGNIKVIPALSASSQARAITLEQTDEALNLACALLNATKANPAPEISDVTFTLDFGDEKSMDVTLTSEELSYELDENDNWILTATLSNEKVRALFEEAGLTDEYNLDTDSLELVAEYDGEKWVAKDITVNITKTAADTGINIVTDTDDTDAAAKTDRWTSLFDWLLRLIRLCLNFFADTVAMLKLKA